jgi:hypothetical protein
MNSFRIFSYLWLGIALWFLFRGDITSGIGALIMHTLMDDKAEMHDYIKKISE